MSTGITYDRPRSAEPHILIVSTHVDTGTDEVANILNHRGVSYTRLDTENFSI